LNQRLKKAAICLLFFNLLGLKTCFAIGTPPIITAQPVSMTVLLSGSAAFSVTASSGTTLSYQWLKDGATISGATGSSYGISSVKTNDAGGYSVTVVNAGGTVYSSTATLTVLVPAAITSQPQSQAVIPGQNTSFSVVAGGTAPLSYKWRFNGTNLSGATKASLTLTNVQATDAGSYTVLVTNIAGSITSSVATLTVYVPPAITNQPQSQTVSAGQTAAFSVGAGGTAPFSYQWSFNGTNLSGATNATLTITNVQATDAGNYAMVITNVAGSVTSAVATLTVLVPPTITAQPQSVALSIAQTAVFSVRASGSLPMSYQWRLASANISGATNATLTLTNVQTSQAGNYSVAITNSAGSVTSSNAALMVNNTPAVTSQPQSQTVVQGQTVTFTLMMGGATPMYYYWYLNGSQVASSSGSSTSAFTITNVQTSSAGTWYVKVYNLYNLFSPLTTTNWTLTVIVPPTITNQPLSQTVVPGTNVSFSVGAGGTAPFSYQWNFNGTNVSGATNATLTLTNVQTNSTGSYAVVVANSLGSVTSAVATLTVYVPPAITTQPQSQAVAKNDATSFSVSASGTAPLGYQWRHNGTPLSGATSSTLTLAQIKSGNVGSYTVVVTNTVGSVTSAVAVLTMDAPPFILTQPQNQTVNAGQNASFSVVAIGLAPVTCQWRLNGSAVAGATNSTLVLANIQANQAGGYTVVLANNKGSVTSSNATLTVNIPPGIMTQPQSQAVVLGQNASFSVGASGTAPFSYQWNFSGTNLSGATNASLTLTNVQATDAGSYTVVVTNIAGSITSAVATLTVYLPPAITTQPQSQSVVQGQNASFSVMASGTTPFSYQWNLNGTNLSGATNATLALTNAQATDAGNYTVVVTNIAGSITSAVATLTVNIPPGIQTQPTNQAVVLGQNASFSVGAGGTAPFSYQWTCNGTNLSGTTNAMLALTNVQTNNAGNYAVVVTNSWGSVTSAVATLTVYVPPTITSQPQSQAVVLGQNVSFPVVPGGTSPFGYQWSFNGTNLAGATSSTLALNGVQTNNAGTYSVVVTNVAGAVTSAVATLTVYVPPSITTQPASQAVVQGQTAVFSVGAGGTAPLKYQWRFSGTNLAGATNATLTLTNVQPTKAGNYLVVVTNSWGSATSAVAALTVYVPPAITNQPASQALILGQNATFTVGASGTAPLTYQWIVNGTNLYNGTNASLTITNIQITDAASYSVVVTNIVGSVTSSVATLTVYVPPTITTQPQSTGGLGGPGSSATFSVVASGTAPLTYQWYYNSTAMGSGSTSSNLTVTPIGPKQVGNYSVVVTGPGGSVTSVVATLTVYVLPAITSQPASQALILGQNATFSVGASGTAPLNYQWSLNGTNLSGATNLSLTLTNIDPTDAGSYTVVVINLAGSVTSTVATLTVYVPPAITNQPDNLAVVQSQTAVFFVEAGGTAPLKYQWRFSGTNLAGATNATLTLTNVQPTKAGNYLVVVTNSGGSATSAVAALTVYVPPAITNQPASQALILGQTATFSVGASGTAPLNYQWSINSTNIPSGTNASLTLTNVQTTDAGSYTVVATNIAGSATSSVVTLTVYVPPSITTQPQSQAWIQGQTAAFSVAASGTSPLRYRWNFNGTNLSSATNASLTLTNIQPSSAGNYSVVATNIAGSVTSTVAALTVYVPPTITNQPQSQALILGQTATFSVGASGTTPLNYQWSINSTNIPSGTNASLTLTNVQTTDAGSYTVVVTNIASAVTSVVATLTVYVPPTITTQPQSLTLLTGQNAVFSVVAGGSSPFTYQWYFNGSPAGGASNSPALTLTNIDASDAGNYTVVVAGPGGSVTSSVATLTIYGIQTQPQNLAVIQGQNAAFSVVPSGPTPLGYQWFFNGSAMSGATAASLNLTNAQTTQAGSYLVVLTTPVGSITSQVATLTVYVPAFITNQPQSLTLTQGQTAVFSVGAGGTAPLKYQWRFSGTNLSGATNATLTLPNVQPTNTGNYVIVVTNSWGAVTSTVVTLTVLVPAWIQTQPANQAVILGQNTFFSVGAAGDAPLSYQWSYNGTNTVDGPNLSGSSSNILRLSNVQTNQAGNYTVMVANNWGAVTSTNATLTVYLPTVITNQPDSLAMNAGQTAVFSIGAGGSSPFTYQWYFNGSSLGSGSGAQTATLTVGSLVTGDAGNYWVAVSGPGGSVTSQVATLTVYVPPSISTQPANKSVVLGQTVAFSVTASGSPAPSYQWNVNGTNLIDGPNISGSTSNILTLSNAQPAQAGNVFVVITNYGGSITSSVRTLTVNIPAFITTQPQNQMAAIGQNASFSVVASGTATLSYQWYFNGAKMGAGSTSSTLARNSIGTNNAGSYTVVVKNNYGSVTSAVATLTVYVPPAITNQPQSQTLSMGQAAAFSVGASGTATLGYQWCFNGTALSGATNAALALTGVHAADAGSYTVVVTNLAGLVTSAAATLTVTNPVIKLSVASGTGMNSSGFTFQFSMPVGITYVILTSTNFQDWMPIATNVALTGNVVFTDATAANYSQRYYKLMTQ
jgi:hypothetical protein